MLGFTYSGFAAGQIDDHSYHYADEFNRMLRGACSFTDEYLEFGAAFELHGRRLLDDPRIGWVVHPLPRRSFLPPKYDPGDKEQFFLYLRRSYPDAEALVNRINETIARWRSTGRGREVLSRYIDLDRISHAR
jgi:hypothetical protein